MRDRLPLPGRHATVSFASGSPWFCRPPRSRRRASALCETCDSGLRVPQMAAGHLGPERTKWSAADLRCTILHRPKTIRQQLGARIGKRILAWGSWARFVHPSFQQVLVVPSCPEVVRFMVVWSRRLLLRIGLCPFSALAVFACLLGPRLSQAQPSTVPSSLPLKYYEERGLIPGRVLGIAVPEAASAVRSAPPTGYRAASATVTLTQPTTFTVDLTSQTRVVNRSIRLTNTGTVDVRNPWVVANGTRDWYDSTRIMKEAVGTGNGARPQSLPPVAVHARVALPLAAGRGGHGASLPGQVPQCIWLRVLRRQREQPRVPAAHRGFHRCALLGHPGACDPRGQL